VLVCVGIQYANPQTAGTSKRSVGADEGNLILPGTGVGQFKLDATKQSVFDALPFKPNVDQAWGDDCGYIYNWVELDTRHPGNVFFRFNDDRISQINSLTPRYHTKEGITVGDSPDRVQRQYKDLRAYVLLGVSSRATGDRDMIYWLDQSRGIAFGFAYSESEHQRYLWQIIVFRPGTLVCEEGIPSNSPKWRELPAYSLEPPHATATMAPTR
jgi:hypothetical protein